LSSRAQAGSRRAAAPQEARKKATACPICGKKQIVDFRPFCSKHCADIDLSRWLGGRYAIPGAPADRVEADPSDEETGG
jgi:endogenous inhibitor of DNA gyrase (YacG/DUF329 family)